ncbi:MAG: transcriptional regulator [Euryarchaeota archaeon RBG_19FT_COMBO_69_17]|nr:MAG: transcriptional regulator [Euryarchaeota archaeon RBG_19FT_COMBO_69_17]
MAIPRFWREIPSRYNLIGTKCGSCGKVDFPPREICPDCGRKSLGKMHSFRLSGKGSLVTFAVVHDAPAQLEMQKPYVVGIFEMDEGVRLTSQLISVEPGDVKIGMRVQAVFRKLGQQGEAGVIHYGYKFRPSL